MKLQNAFGLIVLAVTILLGSCTDENKFIIDVSNNPTKISIKRLDKDILNFDKEKAPEQIKNLKENYGEFFRLYNYKIIGVGSSDSADYPTKLTAFLQYCDKEDLPNKVETQFSNFEETENQILQSFKHYNHYFPKKEIPQLYTCISGFLQSISTGDEIVSIALDKYLGANTEAYKKLGWDNYKTKRMIPSMIPVDVMRAVAMADFPYESSSDNMLDNMIYQGKIQYFMNCMMPQIQDSLKWSYTKKQMGWAARHEHKIWSFLVKEKILYSTSKLEIQKYVGDGPFTSPFAAVSAPRAAVFVGYKIIESYMENHPTISLEELMKEDDSRKVLRGAKYNP